MAATQQHSRHRDGIRGLGWRIGLVLVVVAFGLMLADVGVSPAAQVTPPATPGPYPIQNIIVVMMENNGFDALFGTYYHVNPAVNGLQVFTPQPGGTPTPLPQVNLSATPYVTLPVPTQYAASFPNPVPNAPVLLGSASGAGPLNWAQTLSVVPTHLYYANQYQMNRDPLTGRARNNQFLIWDSIEYSSAPPTPQTNAGAILMGHWNLNGSNMWNWAREYTLADNYFMAAFGGSWLNHMYLVCACAGEFAPTPAPLAARAVPVPGLPPGFFLDANSNVRATDSFVVDTSMPPLEYLPPGYPREGPTVPPLTRVAFGGFTTPTVVPARHIGNRLDERNISWAFYAEGYALTVTPGPTSTPGGRTDADHLPINQFPNPAATPGQQKIQDLNNLRQALVTGTNVPKVAFVMPAAANSQHPGEGSLQAGDAWLGPVPTPGAPTPVGTVGLLTAIRNSPIWPNAAVIVTWDENGGFYDHVSPPVVDQWGPGHRVPALIISPYSAGGKIDKTLNDHTSVLKFIQTIFDVPPLGGERAIMGNLLSAFQFPTATGTVTAMPTATGTPIRAPTAPLSGPITSGTPGTAAATTLGQTITYGPAGNPNGVSGTWRKTGSGSFVFTTTSTNAAIVPGSIPAITIPTTVGNESGTPLAGQATVCTPVGAGAPFSTTCQGTTVGDVLLGAQVTVSFALVGGGTATSIGVQIAGATVPTPTIAVRPIVGPLLPPGMLFLPPPPVPFLPLLPPLAPPPPAAPPSAPSAPPAAPASPPLAPAVPVIPEAEPALLLLGSLLALAALRARRAPWR